MTKKQILRLIKSPAVWLLAGIAVSLVVLGFRVVSQEDQYLTVEMIAAGGDWWETLPQTPHWLADAVSPGAVEYSVGGKKLAEILETKKYQEDTNKILWAKIRLLVTPDKARGGWRFQQQPLQVGSTLNISPGDVKLAGSVITIEGVSSLPDYKNVKVELMLYSRRPWFADSLHIGDTQQDDQGNITAKIIDKSITLAGASAYTSDGRILLRQDPRFRDISLTVELQVVERNGQLYFNQIQPIKIGSRLWIPMKTYNLFEAEIIDFEPR